jgi:hypothetical protein
MKLKAALLDCTLLAAAAAAQGQGYFDAEDTFAIENAQTPDHCIATITYQHASQ